MCKICGSKELFCGSYCYECFLCRQRERRRALYCFVHKDKRDKQTWLGDRMAEIKAVEIRDIKAVLKANGGSMDMPAIEADKILEKVLKGE